MSLSHATHENTQEAVIATTLPPLNRIDEKSLDLQQTVNNFCLFYGEISELPSVHEHRILNSYDLLVLDFDKVSCKNIPTIRKQGGKTLARVSLLTGGSGNGTAVAIDIATSGEIAKAQDNTTTSSQSFPSSPASDSSNTPQDDESTKQNTSCNQSLPSHSECSSSASPESNIPPLPTSEQLAQTGSTSETSEPMPASFPSQPSSYKYSTPKETLADVASSSSSSTPTITECEPSSSTSPTTSNIATAEYASVSTPVVATVTKPKISAVSSMGRKKHKGAKKEFTNVERLVLQIQSLKNRDGLDGIFITDIDEAVEQFGYSQIEFVVARLVDEVNNYDSPMIVFVDGGAFFVATAWLPAIVHGIIMHNPTLEEYGDFKLLPRDEVTQVLDTAKVQTQRRVDFTVLAQENIALDNIRSGMVRRFVKFCQENKVVANLNLDSTMTRAEMVHLTPDNPLGPVAVLSAPFFDDYFKSFRMHAASDGKRKSDEPWHKALLHEVLVFAKTLGHEVDPASLQEPFAILREKHKHSAYVVWLGLLAHVFHLLSTKCASKEDHSQDIYEETSNIIN